LHPRLDERQHLRLLLGQALHTLSSSYVSMPKWIYQYFVDITSAASQIYREGSSVFKNRCIREDQQGGRQQRSFWEIVGDNALDDPLNAQ
jgi:hypothetical protein